jgi:putative transposase
MPRRARTVAAGFPMHAILRGIDRAVIFFHDSDYRVLLDMLAERAAAESVRIHAYVLMTNHLHLLMTPETERGPSSLMKGLGQRYVQHINRTDRRTGTLFEGRFRSSVIEADTYLLACQRYIELNPVRAGMVQAPGDYPWSSYRGNEERKRALVRGDPVGQGLRPGRLGIGVARRAEHGDEDLRARDLATAGVRPPPRSDRSSR